MQVGPLGGWMENWLKKPVFQPRKYCARHVCKLSWISLGKYCPASRECASGESVQGTLRAKKMRFFSDSELDGLTGGMNLKLVHTGQPTDLYYLRSRSSLFFFLSHSLSLFLSFTLFPSLYMCLRNPPTHPPFFQLCDFPAANAYTNKRSYSTSLCLQTIIVFWLVS